MTQSTTQRVRFRFEGRVQGVGFRATATSVAARFPISGWVRNEHDGSVVLEAQGEPGDIDAFLKALRDRMSDLITRTDRQAVGAEPEAAGFEIRR